MLRTIVLVSIECNSFPLSTCQTFIVASSSEVEARVWPSGAKSIRVMRPA